VNKEGFVMVGMYLVVLGWVVLSLSYYVTVKSVLPHVSQQVEVRHEG